MTENMGLWKFPKTVSDGADVMFCGRLPYFTAGKQRPEKLDRRWLNNGCVTRRAIMSKQSGDADETRQQMTGRISQQSTVEPSGVLTFVHQVS